MAKKKGKDKAPKRLAGVKVPKAMRGGLVASFLDDPRTREILADVLMAAAGAAAAALVKHRPSGREVAEAGAAAAGTTRDVAQGAAEIITDTVTEAARHILPSSMTGAGDSGGKDRAKDRDYAHIADDSRKGKKDKGRPKASKH